MRWLRMVCAGGLLAAQATVATAADMPDTLPPPIWHAPLLIDLNTGWYLRADLGYAWGRLDGAESPPAFPNAAQSELGNSFFGGVGIGIKSQWLRTDLTIDYLAPLDYTGGIFGPGDVLAKVSALGVLFNGYLDLGTWYQVTPYIGAGAGAAYMNVSDYSSSIGPLATSDAHHQWNFAWAAMAGLAYPMSHNLMLDVGYRYINFGDVSTEFGALGDMTLKNVAAQEVRVGLRWSFHDLP